MKGAPLDRGTWRILAAGILVIAAVNLSLFVHLALGFLILILLPSFIILYRRLAGRFVSSFFAVASGMLPFIIYGPGVDPLMFFVMSALGYIAGEMIERGVTFEKTVAGSVAFAWIIGFLAIFAYGQLTGEGLLKTIDLFVSSQVDALLKNWKSLGVAEVDIKRLAQSADEIKAGIKAILAGITISFLAVVAWLNLLLAKKVIIAAGKGDDTPFFTVRAHEWKAPEHLVWVLIVSGFLLFAPWLALRGIGANGVIICLTIYLFQGMAVVNYFLESKEIAAPVRGMIYIFIFISRLAMLGVALLGLFDLWIDLRGKIKEKKSG